MRTRCRRKRSPHAIWCSAVLTTDACTAIPTLTVGRDRANISDKSVASLANQIALPNAQQRRSAASGDATSRCPNMDSLDGTWPDGRGIRENHGEPSGESAARQRAEAAADRATRSEHVSRGERCCSSARVDESRRRRLSVVLTNPGGRRSRDRLERGAWHGDISQIGR